MLAISRADDETVLFRLQTADSWLARLRGLIGRPGIASGEGLYLPGTNGVHMFFMRFPIDCVFVGAPRPDGARPVVAVKSNLTPWRGIVWWIRGARGAIEVAAGAATASGLRPGDYVRLEQAA